MSKTWKLGELEFTPIFGESADGQDIECKSIKIKLGDKDETVNFVNLYQFIYFAASEELRMGLAHRVTKQVNRIPYEVTFKLEPDEIKRGMAKRRIELSIDELTMAVARNEAWKLMPGVATKIAAGANPAQLFRKK